MQNFGMSNTIADCDEFNVPSWLKKPQAPAPAPTYRAPSPSTPSIPESRIVTVPMSNLFVVFCLLKATTTLSYTISGELIQDKPWTFLDKFCFNPAESE